MSGPRVLVATRNRGKLRELRPLLEAAGYEAIDLTAAGIAESPEEEAVESHATFEENAVAKARYFAALLPGVAVMADDSGLAVHALGGAPGVHSRRWAAGMGGWAADADGANNARLVRELAGTADRSASFVCAAAWAQGGRVLVRRGEVPGRILSGPRGAEGFGYDPYFLCDELGITFAEASVEEKGRVSHRARAVAALLEAVATGADDAAPRGD